MRSALLTRPMFRASPFDDVFRSFWSELDIRAPHLTSSWDDDGWTLTVDLPGVPTEAVSVSVAGRNLHIKVDTDELKWERTTQLRSDLDPESVTARYVHGRLTVNVGPTAKPEARQIAIETTPEPAAIEATSESSKDEPQHDESRTDES